MAVATNEIGRGTRGYGGSWSAGTAWRHAFGTIFRAAVSKREAGIWFRGMTVEV